MRQAATARQQAAREQAQIALDNQTQAGMFGDQPTLSREQLLGGLPQAQPVSAGLGGWARDAAQWDDGGRPLAGDAPIN